MVARPIREWKVDELNVLVFETRDQMGRTAAARAAEDLRRLLREKERVNAIFAAAPSQNEMLDALAEEPDIDWVRVVAMHMDEYVGLPEGHPQSFGRYLKERIFDRVEPGRVEYIRGWAEDPNAEAERYEQIVRENPPDIVFMGIGENGHIAFNDPPVADFDDPRWVKVVELEERCRLQQVHDGCFSSLQEVPLRAITLTVPALMSARYVHCVVPGPTKREAVQRTLTGSISEECPATILRKHPSAHLYLDRDSAEGVLEG